MTKTQTNDAALSLNAQQLSNLLVSMERRIIPSSGRPTVVTLCGPTRFREGYRRTNAMLTLNGFLVLSCGVFKGDPEWGEEAKLNLDALHLQKINLADAVVVIGTYDQAGESTRREIAYAETCGLPIFYAVLRDPDGQL